VLWSCFHAHQGISAAERVRMTHDTGMTCDHFREVLADYCTQNCWFTINDWTRTDDLIQEWMTQDEIAIKMDIDTRTHNRP